jgi:hypothetical protein
VDPAVCGRVARLESAPRRRFRCIGFGYVTFGYPSDRFGRKPGYVIYLVTAAVLMLVYMRFGSLCSC